jgi:hypothetical protein
VPITENLAEWLKDVRQKEGPVWGQSLPYLFELQRDTAKDAGVVWKHNALRHSFISYRVASIKNVAEVALEAGNSPDIIFQHYRELVTGQTAKEWFGITPASVKELREKAERERQEKIVAIPDKAAA